MSRLKKEIVIKQVTPIIHFQAGEGNQVTLRSTELKPKIDKFIINDLIKVNKELYFENKEIINAYFKKKNEENLVSPYKLTIRVHSTNTKLENNRLKGGTYFGRSNAMLCEEKISIRIFSFNEKITSLIEEAIRYVLILNNFGTRQSKGYGGFVPCDITEEEFENILKLKYNSVFKKKNTSKKAIEAVIKRDYQLLKSGLNERSEPYRKSELMKYFSNNKITWEKRMVKEIMINRHKSTFEKIKGTHECEPTNIFPKQRYVRAMLGLTGGNKFRNIKGNEDVNIIIKDSNKFGIERYKSPILIKIFNNNIYFMANEINNAMFNHNFDFILNVKVRYERRPIIEDKLITLKTPSKEEFNIEKFLDYSLTNNLLGYTKLGVKGDS